MKPIRSFLIFFFSITLFSSVHARSVEMKCSKEALTKEETTRFEKLVRESEGFKNIRKLNAAISKVKVSRCNKVEGNVHASFILLENILGKKCSINSMTFPFSIKDKKVQFKKVRYDNKKSLPKNLDRVLMIKTMEEIAKSKKAKDFFSANDFCQIEYNESNGKFNWVMQLRNQKKFCFLEASSDGKKVKELKKRYGKPGSCK